MLQTRTGGAAVGRRSCSCGGSAEEEERSTPRGRRRALLAGAGSSRTGSPQWVSVRNRGDTWQPSCEPAPPPSPVLLLPSHSFQSPGQLASATTLSVRSLLPALDPMPAPPALLLPTRPLSSSCYTLLTVFCLHTLSARACNATILTTSFY